MTIAISKKTWLGEAQEATSGTGVFPPTRYVPSKSVMKTMRKPIYSQEDRNSRDMNFVPVFGPRYSTLDVSGRWFNDSCPWMLSAWMGGYSVSGAGPYVHSFTMADVPPTYSLVKGYANEAYKLIQSGCEKLEFSVSNDKVLEYNAAFQGKFPIKYTTPPSPSAYTGDMGFAGYLPTITLTSLGATTTDIIDVKITHTQKLELWSPVAGSPDFSAIYFGEREVDIEFTARFDALTLWDTYWAPAAGAATAPPVDDEFIISVTTGTSNILTLTYPLCNYESLEHDEGKINLMVKAKMKVRPDPTLAAALMTASVTNSVATYAAG